MPFWSGKTVHKDDEGVIKSRGTVKESGGRTRTVDRLNFDDSLKGHNHTGYEVSRDTGSVKEFSSGGNTGKNS